MDLNQVCRALASSVRCRGRSMELNLSTPTKVGNCFIPAIEHHFFSPLLILFSIVFAENTFAQCYDSTPDDDFALPIGLGTPTAADGSNLGQQKARELIHGQWSFVDENDAFAIGSGSDEFYTQGLRFSYTFAANCEPTLPKLAESWIRDSGVGRALKLSNERYAAQTTFAFGQHFFTPTDISEQELIPDDRPYAGWLYLMMRLEFSESEKDAVGNLANPVDALHDWFYQSQHSIEAQLGVIGPSAQGKWVQTKFHDLIDDETPRGWINQIPDEPGILLTYRFQRRFAHQSKELDLVPSAVVALGNVQTYAGLGAVIRYGKNISGFPSRNLEPTRGALDAVGNVKRYCGYDIFVECYAFIGIEGRYMARNIFLDGSTWRDSHSVDKESFVYDLMAGFRTRFAWKGLTIDYLFIRRSNEFSPTPAGAKHPAGRHDFGSIGIKFNWNL